MKFMAGATYRHVRDFCTFDIKVIIVDHVNAARTKLKIMYINKFSSSIQYTGRGRDGITDRVTIKAEDYDQWTRI